MELGQALAESRQIESEAQHLLMVISEKAVSLQSACVELKNQVVSLQTANS